MATQRSITPTEPVLVVGGTGKTGRRVAEWLRAPGSEVRIGTPRAFAAFMRHGAAVERTHKGDGPGISWCCRCGPQHQRQGLGTRLVEPILECADCDGATCRLETSDPANVAFYERFGFEVVEGGVPGAPVLTAMRRPPRARRRTHQGG
jgi:GNAT superfamily N-acetyltransferase